MPCCTMLTGQKIKAEFPDNFRVDYALSREQQNKNGGKMYIQDKVEEYAEEIFDRMDKGAHASLRS